METEHKEALAATTGYPDPWLSLHRRVEGLRLLTTGDLPETARMHRLVGATLARRMPQGARAEKLDQLARFLCNSATPFGYSLPIEVFLRAWRLIGEAQPLTERFMRQAGGWENVSPDLAERWTDLSYRLGDSVLEEWWLMRWAGEGPTNHAYAQRRASLMHRQGDTEGAAHLLREHLQSCGENFDTSIQIIMYLSQLGRHQEAEALAGEVATRHAALLSNDPLRRAEFLHCRYFILHELEKNSEAVDGLRFVRDTYVQNHLTYDSLIATVNLGDALWAVGKPHEAAGLLRSALADAQSSGLAQVENIAAICLGNVLSSIGSHAEAAQYYELGLALTHRIGHRWDLLYAQNYQGLNDVELRKASCAVFSEIRKAAAEAGLGYLAELADAHICIASFTEQADESHLQEAMDRGLRSIFPAVRLYALSALIRRQLALDHAPDAGKIREWVSALEAVQGIKGRIGVIARTAQWLLETDKIAIIDVAHVRDWLSRYVPDSLSEYFRTQYRSPIEI
jgi:tetratricopeptide (TPR) repeat protein